jgi:hypothetical protein
MFGRKGARINVGSKHVYNQCQDAISNHMGGGVSVRPYVARHLWVEKKDVDAGRRTHRVPDLI